jgi:chlorophyll synthase
MASSATRALAPAPSPAAVVELLKPITWFPPMWAFGCGAVSAGLALDSHWWLVGAGVLLAGPLLCATSQAINDWFDRHVDAINEPQRPIPSGRVAGRWGLYIAVAGSVLSLATAAALGPWVLLWASIGLVLAWAYSAPPVRLKRNGWWGNTAVGLSYEGLAWITGASVIAGGLPAASILVVALLYSAGAHGIMTLNDFKSIAGDRRMGIGSLPVRLGPLAAAGAACLMMAAPQAIVIALLAYWAMPWHAAVVAALLAVQLAMMRHFLRQPAERALWFSAFGVNFFVLGMLATALALRTVAGGAA